MGFWKRLGNKTFNCGVVVVTYLGTHIFENVYFFFNMIYVYYMEQPNLTLRRVKKRLNSKVVLRAKHYEILSRWISKRPRPRVYWNKEYFYWKKLRWSEPIIISPIWPRTNMPFSKYVLKKKDVNIQVGEPLREIPDVDSLELENTGSFEVITKIIYPSENSLGEWPSPSKGFRARLNEQSGSIKDFKFPDSDKYGPSKGYRGVLEDDDVCLKYVTISDTSLDNGPSTSKRHRREPDEKSTCLVSFRFSDSSFYDGPSTSKGYRGGLEKDSISVKSICSSDSSVRSSTPKRYRREPDEDSVSIKSLYFSDSSLDQKDR